jgi:hypothetical protein
MSDEIYKVTVVLAGIGKDGKIKCYLSKLFNPSTGKEMFSATVATFKVEVNLDWRKINADLGNLTKQDFRSFDEAANWVESRCEEFSSLIELHPVPKETNICH